MTQRAVATDGPSWIDLTEIRVTRTESRFAAYLNRLLQQNRHKARRAACLGECPLLENSRHVLEIPPLPLLTRMDIGRCGWPDRSLIKWN